MDPGLNRSNGNVQCICNLLVFIAFKILDEGRGVLFGNGIQCPLDVCHGKFSFPCVAAGTLRKVGRGNFFFGSDQFVPSGISPVIIDKGIAHDGKKPGVDWFRFRIFHNT